MISCLSYALRFWDKQPKYKIYYDSDHCINLYDGTFVQGFVPIQIYGYEYFAKWHKLNLITNKDLKLLKKYFELEPKLL